MRLSVSEVLNNGQAITDRHERIQYLRANFSKGVATVLKFALDPKVVWLLPPGVPPYRATEAVESQGLLHHYCTKLWIFVDGVDPPSATDWLSKQNIKPSRREQLFIQYLEAMDPADAALVVACKEKKLPYKYLTDKFVRECFPGLLSEEPVVETPKPEKPKKAKKPPKAYAIKEEPKVHNDLAPPPGKPVDIDAVLASN